MVYFDGLSYIGLEDVPSGQEYRWFRDESDEECNIANGLREGYKFVPYSRHKKKLELRVESFPIGESINHRGLVLMERPKQPILNGADHPDYKEWVKKSIFSNSSIAIVNYAPEGTLYEGVKFSEKSVARLNKLQDRILFQSRIQEHDMAGEIIDDGQSKFKLLILPLDDEGKR